MILILSASLRPESHSRILAEEARRVLEQDGVPVAFLDLRDHPLPLCDGGPTHAHPNVLAVAERISKATAVIAATPIYNYDASAALKNLVELTGKAWEDKTVGFLCAAGGSGSYMSIMSLANSLMLDFRSLIVPRFVYATGEAFAHGRIAHPKVAERVAELARATARLARGVKA
jgi:FMN reductase